MNKLIALTAAALLFGGTAMAQSGGSASGGGSAGTSGFGMGQGCHLRHKVRVAAQQLETPKAQHAHGGARFAQLPGDFLVVLFQEVAVEQYELGFGAELGVVFDQGDEAVAVAGRGERQVAGFRHRLLRQL